MSEQHTEKSPSVRNNTAGPITHMHVSRVHELVHKLKHRDEIKNVVLAANS